MNVTRMSALDLEARVALWNRAYEGYAVPAHFDPGVLERMHALGDLRDERHGFRDTRGLNVWSLAAPAEAPAPGGVERASAGVAREALDRLPGPPEPWQREDASVGNLGGAVIGLVCGDSADPAGAAAVVPAPGRVGVMRMRARGGPGQPETLRALIEASLALAPGGALRWINVDPDDPASAVLREMGAQLEIRQREMTRDL